MSFKVAVLVIISSLTLHGLLYTTRSVRILRAAVDECHADSKEVLNNIALKEPPQPATIDNEYNSYYVPASTEEYIYRHADDLGYNTTAHRQTSPGCPIWRDPNVTTDVVHTDLMQYIIDLDEYTKRVREFSPKNNNTKDLRILLREKSADEVCSDLDLHHEGVKGLFAKSGQLSYTPTSGFVEPLLPPMRHPAFCEQGRRRLFDLSYIVHDFGAMCRKLKPTSRIVLFDLGASLRFARTESPAVYLTALYHKFGMPFDHIYAYEITPTEPKIVFDSVPPELLPAYHWINVGVDAATGSRLNPYTTLLDKYDEDDLIVIKMDIDTPSLELPLARQLLEDDRLAKLVDQFYFEHHVHLTEMAGYWGSAMAGSTKDSLELFRSLRDKGIPAHFWV